jgi:hypothetical protein
MKAIVVTEQTGGTAGMKLVERPEPQRGRACSSTVAFRRGRASSRTARRAQSGRW